MGHTYTKKFIIYLKFKFNYASCIFYLLNLAYPHPPSPIPKPDSELKGLVFLKSSSGDSNVHQDSETLC